MYNKKMLTTKNVLCIQIVNEQNEMRGLNAYYKTAKAYDLLT